MRQNPIFRRDELLLNRGYMLTALLIVVNAVFSVLVLINLYALSLRAMETGEIRYRAFLELYYALAAAELLLLLLLGPALTAPALTGERERRALPLLLTTLLTPADLVLGKFFSALSALGTLGASTLPLLLTGFVYGGIGSGELFLFLLLYLLTAVFSAAAGMLFSALCRSTAAAMLGSYSLVFVTAGLLVPLYLYRGLLPLPAPLLLFLSAAGLLLLSALFLWISLRRISPGKRRTGSV